jgi:hypothetical protein
MDGITITKTMLGMSRNWFNSLIQDAKDTPLAFPTEKGGNHPIWIVGHLVHSEASLVAEFVLGEKNPLAKWDSLFGMGSVPVADASKYPSIDELLAESEKVRAHTLDVLTKYTDADLSKPSKAPEEYKDMFGTIGQCFAAISLHETFHGGQLSDVRRATGKGPVFG